MSKVHQILCILDTHIEIGLNCSHELATFLTYHMLLIDVSCYKSTKKIVFLNFYSGVNP